MSDYDLIVWIGGEVLVTCMSSILNYGVCAMMCFHPRISQFIGFVYQLGIRVIELRLPPIVGVLIV